MSLPFAILTLLSGFFAGVGITSVLLGPRPSAKPAVFVITLGERDEAGEVTVLMQKWLRSNDPDMPSYLPTTGFVVTPGSVVFVRTERTQ